MTTRKATVKRTREPSLSGMTDTKFERLSQPEQASLIRRLVQKVGKKLGVSKERIQYVESEGTDILSYCFEGPEPWHRAEERIKEEFDNVM